MSLQNLTETPLYFSDHPAAMHRPSRCMAALLFPILPTEFPAAVPHPVILRAELTFPDVRDQFCTQNCSLTTRGKKFCMQNWCLHMAARNSVRRIVHRQVATNSSARRIRSRHLAAKNSACRTKFDHTDLSNRIDSNYENSYSNSIDFVFLWPEIWIIKKNNLSLHRIIDYVPLSH